MRIYPTPIIFAKQNTSPVHSFLPKKDAFVSNEFIRKIQKPQTSTTLFIPNDICYQIMVFLDLKFVLSTCCLISKQWLFESSFVKLSYKIKTSESVYSLIEKLAKSKSSFNSNITELDFSCQFKEDYRMGDHGLKLLSSNDNIRNLISLDISFNRIHDEGIEYFTSDTNFMNLTRLNLNGNYITNKGMLAISSFENFKNLSFLNIAYNDFNDEGLNYLSNSPFITKLTYLNVSQNEITKNGIEFICKSENFKNLTEFSVTKTKIGDEGISILATCVKMPNLSSLSLCDSEIGHDGMMTFATSQNFPKMKHLELDRNLKIDDYPIIELCKNPTFQNLETLGICKTAISDLALKSIAESSYIRNLQYFSINYNNFTREGIQILMSSENFSKLTDIDMCLHNIDDEINETILSGQNLRNIRNLGMYEDGDFGTEKLAKCPSLLNLTILDMRMSDITKYGAYLLCNSQYLINLTVLRLSHNPIGPEGALHISKCENFKSLRKLSLLNCKLKDEGVRYLAQSTYLNSVYFLDGGENEITFTGVEYLCRSRELKSLRSLEICRNNLGDLAHAWLSGSKRFKVIRWKETF